MLQKHIGTGLKVRGEFQLCVWEMEDIEYRSSLRHIEMDQYRPMRSKKTQLHQHRMSPN